MKKTISYIETLDEIVKRKLYTFEALKKSDLFENYWIASNQISKKIVSYMYKDYEDVLENMKWDFSDTVSWFTIKLAEGYETIVSAYITPRYDDNGNLQKNNIDVYLSTILKNFLITKSEKDVIWIKKEVIDPKTNKTKKQTIPLTKIDRSGKEVKVHYGKESTSCPISDDESITLEDTIPSNKYNPEEYVLLECIIEEILQEKENNKSKIISDSYNDFLTIAENHSYLSQAFVFIEDIFKECEQKNYVSKVIKVFDGIDKKSEEYQEKAKNYFVRVYNHELKRYMHYLKKAGIPESEVDYLINFSATDYNQFGRKFVITDNRLHHLRYYNKNDIQASRAK